ncbi:MAG: hypothetical protein ABI380_11710 [Edaphobacter sp.]
MGNEAAVAEQQSCPTVGRLDSDGSRGDWVVALHLTKSFLALIAYVLVLLGAGASHLSAQTIKYTKRPDDAKKQTCQECHISVVNEPVAITALYGPLREGMHRHVFVGGNFVLDGILKDHRDELSVEALPTELNDAMKRTTEFLQTKAAKLTIHSVHGSML